jgi:hypothetical protein
MEGTSMLRMAPLAVAGILVAVSRLMGPGADRTHVSRDPWYADDVGADDDPEPDADTLEAHARRVIANRALAGS